MGSSLGKCHRGVKVKERSGSDDEDNEDDELLIPDVLRMMLLRSGNMNRYELYWVDLNPTKGSEINKVRPCVIVSPNELNKHLKTVVVVPLTSQVRDYYPFRLKIQIQGKDRADGNKTR